MQSSPHADTCRSNNVGHWLRLALERFDARVLQLMGSHPTVPLGLANLAARGQVGAAHIHITRHLPLQGARLNELATMAGISKQAMGDLVNQCVAWGVVRREDDEGDARAKRIVFTETGLSWLKAFEAAIAQTEEEFRQEVGVDVATVVSLGLEAYAADWR